MSFRNLEKTDYRIADLLYLVDWTPYLKIIRGVNQNAIIDIYVYRIWLYNYIFRRTVSEVDEIVNKMLRQLINEIRTTGNPIFVETIVGTNTSRDKILAMSDRLMEKIYERMEHYDSIIIEHQNDGKDLEAVLLSLALQTGLNPMRDHGDADKLAQLQELFNRELLEPISEIALQAARNA